MPGKPEAEDRRQIQLQPGNNYSQPWWRGVEENGSKSFTIDNLNGSKSFNEGPESSVDFNNQSQTRVSPSISTAGKIGGVCVLAS